jgi:hypothetical protein
MFSPYNLLPDGATFYFYDGGLTTPPCSEVVWWNVADKPILITPAQYSQLITLILNYIDPSNCQLGTFAGPAGSTSRPVQELHGRTVKRICPAGFGSGEDAVSSPCTNGTKTTSTIGDNNSGNNNGGNNNNATVPADSASHQNFLTTATIVAMAALTGVSLLF